jgi:endonuclease YncB( thermonuclease family)
MRDLLPLLMLIIMASPLHAEIKSGVKFDADVIDVISGDTFEFRVRLGVFGITQICRMLDYSASPIDEPEGMRAKVMLERLLGGSEITIEFAEYSDLQGNWLCHVWLPDGTHVNELMRELLSDRTTL